MSRLSPLVAALVAVLCAPSGARAASGPVRVESAGSLRLDASPAEAGVVVLEGDAAARVAALERLRAEDGAVVALPLPFAALDRDGERAAELARLAPGVQAFGFLPGDGHASVEEIVGRVFRHDRTAARGLERLLLRATPRTLAEAELRLERALSLDHAGAYDRARARRHLRNLEQLAELERSGGRGARNALSQRFQAENVTWIAERAAPDGLVLVWPA